MIKIFSKNTLGNIYSFKYGTLICKAKKANQSIETPIAK